MTMLGGLQILALGCAYFFLLLFHEIGHAFVAEHFRREILAIDIYGVIGVCSYEYYEDPYEESAIAWGGILAQLIVLVPALLGLFFRINLVSDVLNVILVMFSYFNIMLIIINLAPAKGLDGYKAWGIVPHFYHRNKKRWY